MKLTKMSLVAALLVGSSAFAVENVKVSGNAQLMYNTTDAKGQASNALAGNTGSGTLFDKDSSAADAALNLDISADLAKNDLVTVSAMAGYTVLTTLGLENNFVSNVWGGAHTATANTGASYGGALTTTGGTAVPGAKVENANWFNQANVTVAFNQGTKSAVKLGRMELDTPLAFTETWTIEKNTFEAAVLVNQDIPDTTVVAAYVGNGNGTEAFGQNLGSNVANPTQINTGYAGLSALAVAPVVNGDGKFATYGTDGAYAFGVINNSWKPLTAQLWYYDVSRAAQAYWIQLDGDATEFGLEGLTGGFQYVSVDASDTVAGSDASTTVAGMVGYAMKDMFSAKLAYSVVSSKGVLGAANTATSSGASKLYTEAWWNYGQVTTLGAKSINLTVEAPVEGIADFGLYVTTVDQKPSASQDLTEITVTASRSFGPLDASLAYINASFNNGGSDSATVQAYATLNF